MRHVSHEEGQRYAENNNMLFFETSALNGLNIDILFRDLAAEIVSTENKKKTINKSEVVQAFFTMPRNNKSHQCG